MDQDSKDHSGFENLQCWQACRALRVFVAKQIVPSLPAAEKYRLSDQLIRAARSTTANIAEGHGRYHYADSAKFLSNARGSVQEVLDHLITACDEDLLDQTFLKEARPLITSATKLINGYRAYLNRAKKES